MLDELVEQGRVMKLGDEFRLQTEEGAEWTKEFNQRRASIRDDAAGCRSSATSGSLKSVDDELAGIKLVHGDSKTPRKFDRHWGDDEPTVDGTVDPGLDPRRMERHRGEGQGGRCNGRQRQPGRLRAAAQDRRRHDP